MKKVLLLAVVVLLTSCGGVKFLQETYVNDFSDHTKNGFVISPYHEGYTYESVGLVEIKFQPGRKKGYINPLYHPRQWTGIPRKDWFNPDYNYMLDELVKKAKEMGANGILDLKTTTKVYNPRVTEITFSGFAVKIKE